MRSKYLAFQCEDAKVEGNVSCIRVTAFWHVCLFSHFDPRAVPPCNAYLQLLFPENIDI